MDSVTLDNRTTEKTLELNEHTDRVHLSKLPFHIFDILAFTMNREFAERSATMNPFTRVA